MNVKHANYSAVHGLVAYQIVFIILKGKNVSQEKKFPQKLFIFLVGILAQ